MTNKNINWDASSFFETLASKNKLAKTEEFRFCCVSGLEGFEEAIQHLQSTANFIAVSDISQGYTELNTTPHTRRVKTVFFAIMKRNGINIYLFGLTYFARRLNIFSFIPQAIRFAKSR